MDQLARRCAIAGMSNKSTIAQPAISVPKGGGAVKGIGETFQPNRCSGTGNHSIPIALSPGRNAFGPMLTLEYQNGLYTRISKATPSN
jgi:hypothetical protein